MSRYSDSDPYIDVASGVLKNRLGLRDQGLLDLAEADLVALRTQELWLLPPPKAFDFAYLRKIHWHLFRDVYDWAGELRTVDISKGNNRFAHHAYLGVAADPLFKALRNEDFLRQASAERFCSRAAFYLSELNVLHPFRDGNGRTQREFVQALARESGYQLHWEMIEREAMLTASIESFRGNLAELTSMLQTILRSKKGRS